MANGQWGARFREESRMVNYGSISMDRRDLRSVSIIVILPKPSAVERSAATSHTIASVPELFREPTRESSSRKPMPAPNLYSFNN